jgi:hypothetical protein
MTSLAEVYEGLGEEASRRQLLAGLGLFATGAVLVVAGIVVATTDVLAPLGVTGWRAWEPAGVLAGLGVPAVFLGIFAVLPASQQVRAAAAVGAGVAVLGVALFEFAYPTYWIRSPGTNLTPVVALVYGLGAITTFWCLFTAVATFSTRNDPGGTVELEVTRDGETRVVEVAADEVPDGFADGGASGVGVVGDAPGGDVPTQTNRDRGDPAAATDDAVKGVGGTGSDVKGVGGADVKGVSGTGRADGPTDAAARGPADDGVKGAGDRPAGDTGRPGGDATGTGGGLAGGGRSTPARDDAAAVGDGGAAGTDIRTPGGAGDDADVAGGDRTATDSYCGNCEHFRYVQTAGGMRPYCGFRGEVMDDMDACEEWTPNRDD